MTRADIRFFGILVFFALSCASPQRAGEAGGIFVSPGQSVFASEEFSMMGEIHCAGHSAAGYYSYALKSTPAGTDFLLTGPMGASVKDETAGRIAAAAIEALKGNPDFIKSVKRRGNEIRFRFSRNPLYIKKMTAFVENGYLKRIKLYFRKGFADIEVSDIVYAEN